MNQQKWLDMLAQSKDIHLPLPIDESETADSRLRQKPVLESRLLDDMESLDNWQTITDYAAIELSDQQVKQGRYSLRLQCPTNLPDWLPGRGRGRIYAEPAALRVFDREDWREWNRLSVWIYPVIPGMKSITLRIQLHNDGEHKIPDIYEREGAHNVSLKPDCWNHAVLEFPYLDRDCVTGVSFVYDMCGHEPDAADHCTWYIDQLELQKVHCDVYEGWQPGPGRIAFSGSGYQPGQVKQAVAADLAAENFKVIELESGKVVYQAGIEKVSGHTGALQILDFSAVTKEGDYLLVAGDVTSRAIRIAADVWSASIWKVLNFYLSQRCGYEVPGKHRACHADMLLKKGDQAIVANGGWHDAADLAQGMNNTADGTAALLQLAEKLESQDSRLASRVLEEAKWGLDYTLKMRFGDGYRSIYSSSSIWTDGIIGTEDDIVSEPANHPYTNLICAYAEAIGARIFSRSDPDYARYCLKIAAEDYTFAREAWQPGQAGLPSRRGTTPPVMLAAIMAAAAGELYRASAEPRYATEAAAAGKIICDCQQQDYPDWDRPLRGFFYQDPEHTLVWHHNHHSYSHLPLVALESLCNILPDHPHFMLWRSAIQLNGEYHLACASFTSPYEMIPEGVYHEDEARLYPDLAITSHPFIQAPPTEVFSQYKNQVRQGIALGQGWYLRCFPVWFSFRGNISVQLSQGISTGIAARVLRDYKLYSLAQKQLEWIVGKNPFAQSILYGEGYDYIEQYAVQPGQTVGQLPVGLQTKFDADRPFWPQVNTATYKEVWISSANKWIWNMVYAHGTACLEGIFAGGKEEKPVLQSKLSQDCLTLEPHPATGFVSLCLPAGEYLLTWQGQSHALTLLPGEKHQINEPPVRKRDKDEIG